ncbi:MAG: MoaD/ThiS family protein [Gemmatimonadales bacterium]
MLTRLADGQTSVEAQGTTLGEIVAEVAQRFPRLAPQLRAGDGSPYPFVTFYLNDEDIRFRGGFAAPVRDATRSRRGRRLPVDEVQVSRLGLLRKASGAPPTGSQRLKPWLGPFCR